MAGHVQTVYFDPPNGITYGSNFQPFVRSREVKDKDEDLTAEPEVVKAFRDTWELGLHSYLTYLRDRLRLTHEPLSDSGLLVAVGEGAILAGRRAPRRQCWVAPSGDLGACG